MSTAQQEINDGAASGPSAMDPDHRSTGRFRGDMMVARVKDLLHQGNVRRIVVRNDEGQTVIEIPVTAGVIAAVAAPIVTAVGAIAALACDWTIEVHRREAEPVASASIEAETAVVDHGDRPAKTA